MPQPKQVFMSYHSTDLAFARRLDSDLLKRGIQASIDARFVPGKSRHWTIKEQILATDCVIACLSPQYLADEFSRTQLFMARAYGKRVLPILVATFTPGQSPRIDLLTAGQKYTHAIKGIEELDIADFSDAYPVWGLGSYEKNFERLVDVIQPVPKPAPLNSKLIYVSYNWKDEPFAMRLAKDLELARANVWIDKRNIEIGSLWRSAMYQGLQKADYFIVCLNPDAARSDNVNHEVLVANMRKIPIYPVVSEGIYRSPDLMAELKHALAESSEMKSLLDPVWFTPEVSYETMLDDLKKAVGLDQALESRRDGIFISYRRADSQAITGRIHEHLAREFGAENVFKDVDTIPPGADFSVYYRKWLTGRAAVVLVVMGKLWATMKEENDPNCVTRICKNGDHVRIEVATALHLKELTVLPVLVDEAKMPQSAELPQDLIRLTTINGLLVRHDPDFGRDIERLIKAIRATQQSNSTAQTQG
ncbi:MAG: toll/interleukin-1 receptor domain-containing protein [Nitrospira sp.]|nr:toll/interleukin-1 receptor domain-containing protein [Nitrospira sp.]